MSLSLSFVQVDPAPAPSETLPFVKRLVLTGTAVAKFTEISFRVDTKSGGTAEPVSATYSRANLLARGLIANGRVVVPVFGLYENRTNTVRVTYKYPRYTTTATGSLVCSITTTQWNVSEYRRNPNQNERTGLHDIVARNRAIPLSFSYFMLKNIARDFGTPVVMDIDGEVRWVGSFAGHVGSAYYNGSFFVGQNPGTLLRMELDGTCRTVKTFWDELTQTGYRDWHHNIDPGKDGMLVTLNRVYPAIGNQPKYEDVECIVIEINTSGTILRTWNLATIIRDYIRAAGVPGQEDPDEFVFTSDPNDPEHGTNDWLHINASAYWKSRNELVVSGREDFVISVGYDDKQIKYILGDPRKKWYTDYPCLRRKALTVTGSGRYPIGQHAVSISAYNGVETLMLFDNGLGGLFFPSPNRSPANSACRQYRINTVTMQATEVWTYDHVPSLYSSICSSIYKFGSSFLINYASNNWGQEASTQTVQILGIDGAKRTGFEFEIRGKTIFNGWNAFPFSLSNLVFK